MLGYQVTKFTGRMLQLLSFSVHISSTLPPVPAMGLPSLNPCHSPMLQTVKSDKFILTTIFTVVVVLLSLLGTGKKSVKRKE